MEPLNIVEGIVAPLDRTNVDTDQIIPKQFLKRIERTGFGEFLFFGWRYLEDGTTPHPDFELNHERFQDARIFIARHNFGSGSSREHAPWALNEYGFKVIIAPSFADIFFNNCFKNGMLPIVLHEDQVEELFQRVQANHGYTLKVELETQTISGSDGLEISFDVDQFRKKCLLEGLDDIALTLQHESKIGKYEQAHAQK